MPVHRGIACPHCGTINFVENRSAVVPHPSGDPRLRRLVCRSCRKATPAISVDQDITQYAVSEDVYQRGFATAGEWEYVAPLRTGTHG